MFHRAHERPNRSATRSPFADPPIELPAPEGTPLDLVFIEGFVAHTVIGIHHDELHATQPVQIDLQAGMPRARACDTDRIADTIDYRNGACCSKC